MQAVVSTRLPFRAVAPIRIAYCIDTMRVGGTELNAIRTAERIDRERFSICVASLQPEGPLAARYQNAGIEIEPFPLRSLYSPHTVRRGLQLVRWLRAKRIQILHCHDLYANLFAGTWGHMARVPCVITSRRWTHPERNRVLSIANRCAYHLADRVLVNSAVVADDVRARDGVDARRIVEIPNFVDEEAFSPPPPHAVAAFRRELKLPPRALIVGCIARLVPVKDHITLLRAVAVLKDDVKDLHLVLVGDGECQQSLETAATSMGIAGRVHFAGARPHMPNLHHTFDVSVLTSLSEGFPNSLVEAMAAGRPSVATSVGGNVDAVRPETGVLVPSQDPDRLAVVLHRLARSPVLRRQLGDAGRRIARREYHVDVVIRRLEEFYESVARDCS